MERTARHVLPFARLLVCALALAGAGLGYVALGQSPGSADLALSMAASAASLGTGDQFTYTLRLANAGPEPATKPDVRAFLPDGLRLLAAEADTGACQPLAEAIACTLSPLPSGATVEVRLTVAVVGQTSGLLVASAHASSTEDDPQPADNAPELLLPLNSADLSLSLSGQHDPAAPQVLRYEIRVANAGPATATGVLLTLILPDRLAFTSASAGQGRCAHTASVVTCRLATLDAGSQAEAVVEANLVGSGGTLVASASVAADQVDPAPGDNAPELVWVAGGADLVATLQTSAATIGARSPLTYTLLLRNAGPGSASEVTLFSSLPDSFTPAQISASQGSCVRAPAELRCALGSLGADGTATLTVAGTIQLPKGGFVVGSAALSAAEDDPDPSNNSPEALVAVLPERVVRLPLIRR
jgi:uncharacterized repeat protein (TIGR01451 family)